jgi:hypothetical protein
MATRDQIVTVLQEQLSYWKDRLQGAAVLELPGDHPRPARLSDAAIPTRARGP